MIEIVAPRHYEPIGNEKSLFLGGGISNCPQWQPVMVDMLKGTDLVLFNPRRNDFNLFDEKMTVEQIEWEHKYLKVATARMFWFPNETLCPITLLELGKFMAKGDPLFVGCDPGYQRKIDLEVQMGLELKNYQLSYSLKDISEKIIHWAENS